MIHICARLINGENPLHAWCVYNKLKFIISATLSKSISALFAILMLFKIRCCLLLINTKSSSTVLSLLYLVRVNYLEHLNNNIIKQHKFDTQTCVCVLCVGRWLPDICLKVIKLMSKSHWEYVYDNKMKFVVFI